MKAPFTVLPLVLAVGCAATAPTKSQLEEHFEMAAGGLSEYCANAKANPIVEGAARRLFRRQVRLRGIGGPRPPKIPVPGLDLEVASAAGPVVRIYCDGESPPHSVWEDLRESEGPRLRLDPERL